MRRTAAIVIGLSAITLVGCGSASSPAEPPSSADPRTRPIAFPVKGHGSNLEIRLVAEASYPPFDQPCGSVAFGLDGETPAAEACAAYAAFECPDHFRDLPDGSRIACNGATKYLVGPALNKPAPPIAVSIRDGGLSWLVAVRFDANGAHALAAATRKVVGSSNQIAIVSGGTVDSSAAASAVVTDGRIEISGNYTKAMATRLAKHFTGATTD